MSDGNVPRQLGAILDILGLEYDSLFGPDGGENRAKVVTWLYRVLDTLDSKTSHLLRFASLLLAAQTFLAGLLVRDRQSPLWISVTVLLLLLFPLGAAVFGLNIFKVKWLFFGRVRLSSDAPRDEDRIREEPRELARVCDERAQTQRWTLRLCTLSAGAFGVTLLLALCVVIPFCPCQ